MAAAQRLFPAQQLNSSRVCLHLSTTRLRAGRRSRNDLPRYVESLAAVCPWLQLLRIHRLSTAWTYSYNHCNCLPPPKPNSEFINDFTAFLTHLSPNTILLRDFNIHMNNTNHPLTRDFTSCLNSSGFQQHTHIPTHSKGHILDLICCSGVTPTDCAAADYHRPFPPLIQRRPHSLHY